MAWLCAVLAHNKIITSTWGLTHPTVFQNAVGLGLKALNQAHPNTP